MKILSHCLSQLLIPIPISIHIAIIIAVQQSISMSIVRWSRSSPISAINSAAEMVGAVFLDLSDWVLHRVAFGWTST